MEEIILVTENDDEIGKGEKMQVHKDGLLHRAFSIFIFNDLGQLMLQKRASSKYHSGGLWTNTCCSHPHPGEATIDAAHSRLKDEMGFDTEISEKFSFVYQTQYEGLSEHEFDHVFVGRYNGDPVLNRTEAEEWKWINMDELKADISMNPSAYTSWFKIAMERLSTVDISI